tara:strand:+ start:202 stop:2583 length:2382 start_codon:yes stop_codon:yes gene_type:complete
MKDIEDYLQKKIDSVSPLYGGGNAGATFLKFDKSGNSLETYIHKTIQMILAGVIRSDIAGIAKLTVVSTSIGKQLFQLMGRKDGDFAKHVRTGDVMLEAFSALQYISIYREPSFSEFNTRAPYVLQLETKWNDISELPLVRSKDDLRGTLFEPPKPVTKAIIKRTAMTNKEWEDIADSQHISAVNKLQQTAYKVNLEVLEVVKKNKKIFVNAEKIVIPKEGNKMRMDNAYAKMRMETNKAKGKQSKSLDAIKAKYEKEAIMWNLKLIALKQQSKRTAHEYVIQKAEILKYEDKFYQTVELDYRGRFYYNETFFNFQGTDVARGLMQFARGVPMDASGERALAIHTASSYNESYDINELPDYFTSDYKAHLQSEGLESISVDKLTLDDRASWTNMNIEKIVEWANNGEMRPEAEKPVAFLACCIEWKNLLKTDGEYLTHLPIQIDGSNNGWQHLGAMSKDEKTGDLVGLIPRIIQKDFYVQTAKSLINLMPAWFKSKNMPMKYIRKGISKRGSMTRAYSAGEKTMGTNMFADCHQEGFTDKFGITVEDCNNLAHNLIEAINQVCPGPLSTMSYLQKLASFELGIFKWYDGDGKLADTKYRALKKERKDLMKIKEKTDQDLSSINDLTILLDTFESRLVEGNGQNKISWVTPSGFYVIYECYTTRQLECRGTIKGVGRIKHRGVEKTNFPDARGYASGISPNFTHSMDSSHMSIVIDNWDGDFAAVHDAFATHAPLVEDLLHVTKEVFIQMYDHDNFYDYIEDTLLSSTDNLTVEQPMIGKLNIADLRESDYFFA